MAAVTEKEEVALWTAILGFRAEKGHVARIKWHGSQGAWGRELACGAHAGRVRVCQSERRQRLEARARAP